MNAPSLSSGLLFVLRYIYSPTVFLLGVLVAPIVLFKARGRMRFLERYGILPKSFPFPQPGETWVFFHGASQGELSGFPSLIQELRQGFPNLRVLVSATSPSALQGFSAADYLHLFPIDASFLHAKVFDRLKPGLVVFGESEIWPAWLGEIAARQIPCVLVNARMSERSEKRYRYVPKIFLQLFSILHKVFVNDEASLTRFQKLLPEHVPAECVGNTKYDRAPSIQTTGARTQLARSLGLPEDGHAPVFILASLWPGEENIWLPVLGEHLRSLAEGAPPYYVILAPRHAEKFNYFAEQLTAMHIAYGKRSMGDKLCSEKPVLLLDSLGELEPLYALASLAFIGATLVQEGGHNPLEAAAYACPVILGPYGYNIKHLRHALREAHACIEIYEQAQARDALELILHNPQELQLMGKKAQDIWRLNQGATQKIAQCLRSILIEERDKEPERAGEATFRGQAA